MSEYPGQRGRVPETREERQYRRYWKEVDRLREERPAMPETERRRRAHKKIACPRCHDDPCICE